MKMELSSFGISVLVNKSGTIKSRQPSLHIQHSLNEVGSYGLYVHSIEKVSGCEVLLKFMSVCLFVCLLYSVHETLVRFEVYFFLYFFRL